MNSGNDPWRRLERSESALEELREELAATNEGLLSLTVELERRVDQQTALAELGQRSLDGVALDQFMAEITAVVARIVDATYCSILEFLPDRNLFVMRGTTGTKKGLVGKATVGAGRQSQAGYTLLTGEPVMVENLATEKRFARSLLAQDHGAVSGISVVISGKERPYGVLGTHSDRFKRFSDDDAKLLQAVANLLALSIERKQAQESLRSSERRFRSLFENVVEGVFQSTRDGRLALVNPALVEMLGYDSAAELRDRRWQDFYQNPHELEDAFERLAKEGEIRDAELTMTRKDGGEVVLLKNARLVGDDKGGEQYVEGTVSDITERKRSEAQLQRLANYDSLTSLFNRHRFEEELDSQLRGIGRFNNHGALLWLDVDQFKHINDSFGHAAGDRALVRCAELLRERVRETDIVARASGDEFALLLPHTSGADAETVARDIQERLRQAPVDFDGKPFHLTVSIGIAVFPEHATTRQDLLVCADVAMYAAKEAGRNRFHVYEPDERREAGAGTWLGWATRIRESLEHDAFTLYAQPILRLAGGEVTGYELLLRMRGPGDEIVLPGAFLGSAERFGLADDIDQWVVRRAIRLLAEQRPGDPPLRVGVNISAHSLDNGEMWRLLGRELVSQDVDPDCLTFEITETTAISNITQAQQFIRRMRDMGCRFALDDFGMGFSTFYYLKHLPVDYLKIDGGFIQDLPRNTTDQHLVRAMVQVARGLGMETIAEFVEDEQTLGLLKDYGVDFAQGYHIGRPAPFAWDKGQRSA